MCDGASWIAGGMAVASLVAGGISYSSQQSAIANSNSFNNQMSMMQNQTNAMSFMQQMNNFGFQSEQADKQLEFQTRMLAMQRDNATDSASLDYKLISMQQEQISETASTQEFERIRQGIRERAKARVAAAEAGVGGITPETVQNNLLFQQGYDVSLLEQDKQNKLDQVSVQYDKVQAEAEGRINETLGAGINTGFAYTNRNIENYGSALGSYRYSTPVEDKASLNPLLETLKIGTSAASSGISTYGSINSLKSSSTSKKTVA